MNEIRNDAMEEKKTSVIKTSLKFKEEEIVLNFCLHKSRKKKIPKRTM